MTRDFKMIQKVYETMKNKQDLVLYKALKKFATEDTENNAE